MVDGTLVSDSSRSNCDSSNEVKGIRRLKEVENILFRKQGLERT